jgi:sugar O-acyltransferase (sialic acid O-acetyltransferase NeuD family)
MRLLLLGVGGHARVVAEAIRLEGRHEIAGVVSDTGTPLELLPGLKVLGRNEELFDLAGRHQIQGIVVGLGDAAARRRLLEAAESRLERPTIVHPFSSVSVSTEVNAGVVVMAGACINAGARLGLGCIINTRSSVDHDCLLGDYVHICPGATVAGHVTIGANTWIGAGATVVDHVTIGRDVFVGAGAIVTKDVADGDRILGGRPARRAIKE